MIKAKVVSGEEQIALIGLSGENMARLMSDEPIAFNLSEMGLPPQQIILVGGKDEATIAARLQAFFGKAQDLSP